MEVTPKMKKKEMVIAFALFIFLEGCAGYDPEASITGLYTGPYFDPLAPRNLTAHLGDEATLPCTVRQLGDKSVSWVRMRDADILTVDRYTFVGDERFQSHYSAPLETWNLVIKYVQERDAGLYECQVSTEPKMSQLFSLRVVIPKVSIEPPGDRYVKAGSTVVVDCQITDVVQLPDYIFWYHEDKRVMDSLDPNLEVTEKRTVESITSTLTIHKVRREGSGNYTCMPSNLHSASVTLHVLNEKNPAAIATVHSGACAAEANFRVTLCVLFIAVVWSFVSFTPNEEDTDSTAKDLHTPDHSSSAPPLKDPSPSSSFLSCSSSLIAATSSSRSYLLSSSNLPSESYSTKILVITLDQEKLKTLADISDIKMLNSDKNVIPGFQCHPEAFHAREQSLFGYGSPNDTTSNELPVPRLLSSPAEVLAPLTPQRMEAHPLITSWKSKGLQAVAGMPSYSVLEAEIENLESYCDIRSIYTAQVNHTKNGIDNFLEDPRAASTCDWDTRQETLSRTSR